jgi:UDP-N-acetylglucosamine 2-epimerase (non-hydrolysing)
MAHKLLFVFGTRPEAIKMAPLIAACKKDTSRWDCKICITAQHREMLDQVLDFFAIVPDYDLSLMKPNQTLYDITADGLKALGQVITTEQPDMVLVQGDTTTAFIGALAAFYQKIKVAHIEAGLRSGDKYSPFPEEINRKLVGSIADYHFAPTKRAADNLAKEQIADHVYTTGNTVIDALLWGVEIVRAGNKYAAAFNYLKPGKKIILVTGHRRESFGKPFENICYSIKNIATKFSDSVQVVYPVHLNPNVQEPVNRILGGMENVHLVHPLDYPHLLWIMEKSHIVLTDSGGIQEEAPSLGKPVLVMREVTERTEGIDAGTAILVGTDPDVIEEKLSALLTNAELYNKMSKAVNPYGDGHAAENILKILEKVI